MSAVKCPECSATFKAVSTSAKVACPKCGAKFVARAALVGGRSAMEEANDEAPSSGRRQIVMAVIGVMALLYLVGGAAVAMYLMKGAKKPADQSVAAAEKEKEKSAPLTETPVNVPVPQPEPRREPQADPRPMPQP